jgi:hypothetical protein
MAGGCRTNRRLAPNPGAIGQPVHGVALDWPPVSQEHLRRGRDLDSADGAHHRSPKHNKPHILGSGGDEEQAPFAGYTFERMGSAVVEFES